MLERVKTNLTADSNFIKGENISILENDLKQVVVQLMKNIHFWKKAIQQKNLKSQWDVVSGGCEQSNSKYNRAKNKYSTTMQLPMIQARMRVGSNGPPMHLFNPEPVLEYWITNRHRLAQK